MTRENKLKWKIIGSLFIFWIIMTIVIISVILNTSKENTIQEEIIESYEDMSIAPAFYYKSPEEGLKEAMEYFEISCDSIVYAQAIIETGNFKSRVCKEDNNLFGLYDSRNKRYYRFDHWAESVKAYKNFIQRRYDGISDYYIFLDRIGYAEAPDYTKAIKLKVKEMNK